LIPSDCFDFGVTVRVCRKSSGKINKKFTELDIALAITYLNLKEFDQVLQVIYYLGITVLYFEYSVWKPVVPTFAMPELFTNIIFLSLGKLYIN